MRYFPIVFLALMFSQAHAQDVKRDQSVFEYAVRGADGTVKSVADAVATAAATTGYEVVARIPAGVPSGCAFTAEVLVLFDAVQAKAWMDANPTTAPYALVDRVNVFSDEQGVHVAFVNPLGIARTILMDDTKFDALAQKRYARLRTLLTGAARGTVSDRTFGPNRDRGYIGRTMGVMAGGPFDDKIQVHGTVPDATVADVAAQLRDALATPGAEWGLKRAFEVTAGGAVVFGVTGRRMESKSFEIVGAGGDDPRKGLTCPGLAHAASYPLELVVRQNGPNVDIQFVDAMYRMKMYFEDAGKWAFMKNMGMPGSLAGELEGLYLMKLGL